MRPVVIAQPASYDALVEHILPDETDVEQVAFMFLKPSATTGHFTAVDQTLVPPTGFVHHSEYHLELTDETRAAVIKTAHDLEASLAEVHSHPFSTRASFSGRAGQTRRAQQGDS